MDHPTEAVLARFAALEATPAENRQVVRHLLAGCPSCAARVQEVFRPRHGEAEYEAAVSRVCDSFLRPARLQASPAKLLPFQEPSGPRATGRPAGSGTRPPGP